MSDSILEIGAAGLETTDQKVKSLVNRMVNAETPGFRSSDVTVRSFPIELEAANKKLSSQKPLVDGTYYNQDPGSLARTGKETDVALGAQGFFVVQCPWGEGYLRDGRFIVDKNGGLVTAVGNYPVLGYSGPITVTLNSQISISETGELRANSQLIDKIKVVDFKDKQALESVNGVIFRDSTGSVYSQSVESPRMVQGFVESSNANIVDQMVDMIALSRIYNTTTKIVSNRETMLTRAIEIGKAQ